MVCRGRVCSGWDLLRLRLHGGGWTVSATYGVQRVPTLDPLIVNSHDILTMPDEYWYSVTQEVRHGAGSSVRQIKSYPTSASPKSARGQKNERNVAACLGFGHGKGRARWNPPAL